MASRVTIDDSTCKGCSLCVATCPKKIMVLNREKLSPKGYNPAVCADPEACIACAMCAIICPESSIKVEKE